ncbi:MAG: GNAT family N-acetyltransferase [Clostridia bacterium]|nr:GNAT family N-acetyltransferase [Clostridia bacterium]
MVYELADISKVEHLFRKWNEFDAVDVELRVFVTDPDAPRSALLYSSVDGVFLAGEPDRELVAYGELGDNEVHPQNEAWEKLIKECWPEAEPTTRYAIKSCKNFDRMKLQSFVDALPKGYEIRRIDSEIYDLILSADDDDLEYLIGDFETKEAFLEKGRGFVVLKDGSVVAGASSEYCYRCGIEVEIDTVRSERRKGLATAVGAKLILSCMDDGLEPVWDAANLISVHLAEKLGYQFDYEYVYYWINEAQKRMIQDPDKSKWPVFCGTYEQLCEDFRLEKVWMQDGNLYGSACNEAGGDYFTFKLLPIGGNTFGRANGGVKITFGDNCLVIDDVTCRKL